MADQVSQCSWVLRLWCQLTRSLGHYWWSCSYRNWHSATCLSHWSDSRRRSTDLLMLDSNTDIQSLLCKCIVRYEWNISSGFSMVFCWTYYYIVYLNWYHALYIGFAFLKSNKWQYMYWNWSSTYSPCWNLKSQYFLNARRIM